MIDLDTDLFIASLERRGPAGAVAGNGAAAIESPSLFPVQLPAFDESSRPITRNLPCSGRHSIDRDQELLVSAGWEKLLPYPDQGSLGKGPAAIGHS